jgi:hypothetical protein
MLVNSRDWQDGSTLQSKVDLSPYRLPTLPRPRRHATWASGHSKAPPVTPATHLVGVADINEAVGVGGHQIDPGAVGPDYALVHVRAAVDAVTQVGDGAHHVADAQAGGVCEGHALVLQLGEREAHRAGVVRLHRKDLGGRGEVVGVVDQRRGALLRGVARGQQGSG